MNVCIGKNIIDGNIFINRYKDTVFSKDGFKREKYLREILSKKSLDELDTVLVMMSLADRVWAMPMAVANNYKKISDGNIYTFFIKNSDLYYHIKGKMISTWANYHYNSSWYAEYPTMPQRIRDYLPYKVIRHMEHILRSKYGVQISRSRNK